VDHHVKLGVKNLDYNVIMLKITQILKTVTLILITIEKTHLLTDVNRLGEIKSVLVVLKQASQNMNMILTISLVKTDNVTCLSRLLNLSKMLLNT